MRLSRRLTLLPLASLASVGVAIGAFAWAKADSPSTQPRNETSGDIAAYNLAIGDYAHCLEDHGVTATILQGEGLRPSRVAISSEASAADAVEVHQGCAATHSASAAEQYYAALGQPSTSQIAEIRSILDRCMASSIEPSTGKHVGTFANYPGDEAGNYVVASGDMPRYLACALEVEAATGWLAPRVDVSD